jgi:hypothetical protein
MLPRRWWPALDGYLPASEAAFPASLLTLLSGAALGITGFFEYLEVSVSATNEVYLATAVRSTADEIPGPSALSVLSLFTFLFFTPKGLAATYLTGSGFVRTLGTWFDDAHGDFALTAIDAAALRLSGRGRVAFQTLQQQRREGPAVQDRVARGSVVGIANAELVIVSSRHKVGWTPGTVVLTDRGAYRIASVEDRVLGGRLRHLYALTPHADSEVFRRTVHYEFPARVTAD